MGNGADATRDTTGVRRRVGLGIAVLALVLGGVGMTFALAPDATAETSASFNAPVVTVPAVAAPASHESTTSTTSTTTTSTTGTTTSTTIVPTSAPTTLAVQQTRPVAPPPNPRGAENLGQLGGISIAKIGLDSAMYEGIRLTTLDRGPGHWPGSAMPGQIGNVVVAAHRTSHGAQFRHIDQLVAGDIVTFTTADGIFDYRVTGAQIVGPDALWITDPSATATATLFACHPPGSTRQRIVVHLELA